MTESSFYIDLVSNASMDVFPDNTLNSFQNKLIAPLEFVGPWEVALTEIFYPAHIEKRKQIFKFQMTFGRRYSYVPNEVGLRDFEIEIMQFETPEVFVELMNSNMERVIKRWIQDWEGTEYPKFKLENGKLIFTPVIHKRTSLVPICSDPNFFKYLGFNTLYLDFDIDEKRSFYADKEVNFDFSPHLMYVYFDFVDAHCIGDNLSESLRVLPLHHSDKPKITQSSITNPNYFRLRLDRYESLKIVLCNEFGEKIKFKSGRVNLTLHFRKII